MTFVAQRAHLFHHEGVIVVPEGGAARAMEVVGCD